MTIRTIDIQMATDSLGEYAAHIAEGTVVVTRAGRPVAAVVALENADLETVTLSEDPRFLALIERSMQRYHEEGGPTLEEVRRELGIGEE